MTAQFIKASALIVAGALASTGALAQEEAPVVPVGPTPQEVAAENLNQLLGLVKEGKARASSDNAARERRFTENKATQAGELRRAEQERTNEERRAPSLHGSRSSLKIMNCSSLPSRSNLKSAWAHCQSCLDT